MRTTTATRKGSEMSGLDDNQPEQAEPAIHIQVPMPPKAPLKWASDYQQNALQELADEAQEMGTWG